MSCNIQAVNQWLPNESNENLITRPTRIFVPKGLENSEDPLLQTEQINPQTVFGMIKGEILPVKIQTWNTVIGKLDELKSRVEQLEEANTSTDTSFICDMSRHISNDKAEIEIKDYLKNLRDEGVEQVDLLDLVFKFNLPPEQVERTIEKLKKRD